MWRSPPRGLASGLLLSLFVSLLIAASFSPFTALAASKTPVRVAIPAYFGGMGSWSLIASSYPSAGIAVLNPQSGPGAGPVSFLASDSRLAQEAGVKVVGYVPTGYAGGTISLSQAEEWVDEYFEWYAVNGILFDEVSSSCSPNTLSQYSQLYQYVKGKAQNPLVILNPGQPTGECYAAISDILVTFEGSYATYVSSYRSLSWMTSYSPSHFWNVVYETATSDQMSNAVSLAAQRGIGWIYVTDGPAISPYSKLPSYFSQEVSLSSVSFASQRWAPTILPTTPTFNPWDATHYIW